MSTYLKRILRLRFPVHYEIKNEIKKHMGVSSLLRCPFVPPNVGGCCNHLGVILDGWVGVRLCVGVRACGYARVRAHERAIFELYGGHLGNNLLQHPT